MDSSEKNKSIKRFIEVQLKPGEKYDYRVIEEKFNKVLSREENKELRNYRLILGKINNVYKSLVENNKVDISDWYIDKLKEFIFKYRQISFKKDNKEIKQQYKKNISLNRESTNKFINKTQVSVSDSRLWSSKKMKRCVRDNSTSVIKRNNINQQKTEFPPKVRLFHSPSMDRGTYWQEANTDEFGCVLVCRE